MKAVPHCYPCALRRALTTASRVTDDGWLQQKVIDEGMRALADAEPDQTPAELVSFLLDSVHRTLGVSDPWESERSRWLEEMLSVREALEKSLDGSQQPLRRALLLSARANVFDNEILSTQAIREDLTLLGLRGGGDADSGFAFDDFDRFQADLAGAGSLLILHDSAPELPFDRVLLERILVERPGLKITSIVRRAPLLLDAVAADARVAGIEELVDGVVPLELPGNVGSGEGMRNLVSLVEASDLVIAKGQGHYETMVEAGISCYSLMRVKCPVMASAQGCRIGDLLLVKN